MSRASSLYRMQSVDLELDRSHSRLTTLETESKNADPVARSRAELLRAEADLQAARSASKTAEHNVASHQSKLEASERSLYSGSGRSPKELQDLQNEVEALKRYRPTLEDRLLEAMVALEEAELRQEAASRELLRMEALHAAQTEALTSERDQIAANIARLEGEREAALADVPEEDQTLYEQLRASRGSVAVALLQDDSCSACGLTQAKSLRQSIRMSSDLIRCRQCGRILYAG